MIQSRLASWIEPVISITCALVLFTVPSHAGIGRVLHNFSTGGKSPTGDLIADSHGNLYGTTASGGTGFCPDGNNSYGGCGTVFELAPTGKGNWKRTVLYNFQGGQDGQRPLAGLVLDSAGNLYGTTSNGGGQNSLCIYWNQPGCGTVFELTRDVHGKWIELLLHRFTGYQDGALPQAKLVLDSEGNLYGTTKWGGSLTACANLEGCGVVFKLSPNASGKWKETVLYAFGISASGVGPTGAYPQANVVFDSEGRLYGTTYGGGFYGYGAVFRLSPNSEGQWREDVLRYFDSASDGYPTAGVLLDNQNNVYGTTQGNFSGGTVFELQPLGSGIPWKETVLYAGGCPQAGLAWDRAGNLYGTNTSCSNYGPGAVFELSPGSGGWNYAALHTFVADEHDGFNPLGGALLDQLGNLYGTTALGGPAGGTGLGTVYKLTPSSGNWTESIISFFPGEDGASPQSNLVVDTSGDFYGTTAGGGKYGLGTVFKEAMSTDGSWHTSILYSFRGESDGSAPVGGVTFDANGNLYGTAGISFAHGWGTVFMLSPRADGSWEETTLYTFTDGSDGALPNGGLTLDSNGNIYGTTSQGGSGVCRQNYYNVGCGTVFELSPSYHGWSFWLLYTFTGGSDGGTPLGGVVSDHAGNLYGSTSIGGGSGCNGGCGTVFELSPVSGGKWNEATIYSFAGEPSDGSYPAAALILDTSGNLYGTTAFGGVNDAGGTVFEVTPSGKESVLYSFTGGADGNYPVASLTFDTSGRLYGTTSYGGDSGCWRGCGTVFRLTQTGGNWSESTLYDFIGRDGGLSVAGVVLDAAGNVYGTTEQGGPEGNGIFFEITP
jgi:uncharacterized repeat protein (TIGR03803 family)